MHDIAALRVDPAQNPSVRADVVGATGDGATVVVRAQPGTVHHTDDGPGGLTGALARWGETFARAAGVGEIRAAPTLWCSWYHYSTRVTEADIDDGYQAELTGPA